MAMFCLYLLCHDLQPALVHWGGLQPIVVSGMRLNSITFSTNVWSIVVVGQSLLWFWGESLLQVKEFTDLGVFSGGKTDWTVDQQSESSYLLMRPLLQSVLVKRSCCEKQMSSFNVHPCSNPYLRSDTDFV